MTKPVYKIEVWEPGGVSPLHTIEDKILSIHFKDIMTSGVGHFSFSLPTKSGGQYEFADIDLYDTVKIWLNYGSISGDPDFIGKIFQITGPLSIQQGYIRLISGLSQGEVLLRKHKTNKLWKSIGASTIVTEIASDAGLGIAKIESDVTSVDLEVETKTRMDVLQLVSDYWYDATTKIQKDFYVNINNDLVWATRDGTAPFRSGASVESFIVGGNIIHYRVVRDVVSIKRSIKVYGARNKTNPSDPDGWGEATTGWTSDGTLSVDTDKKVGTSSINATAASTNVYMEKTTTAFSAYFSKEYQRVKGWFKGDGNSGSSYIDLYVVVLAPDYTNRFYNVGSYRKGEWHEFNLRLGSLSDGKGDFINGVGSPDWKNIGGLRFVANDVGATSVTLKVDAPHFGEARTFGSASDASSPNYGNPDLEAIDDNLVTNVECTSRAEALLAMNKDPPTQVEITVAGNKNVLLGDRVSLTIPAENISATNFDIYIVENMLDVNAGFLTKATMVNNVHIRKSVVQDQVQALVDLKRAVRMLAWDEKIIA